MNDISNELPTNVPRKIFKSRIAPSDKVTSKSKGCCCSRSNRIDEEKPEENTQSCCSKN